MSISTQQATAKTLSMPSLGHISPDASPCSNRSHGSALIENRIKLTAEQVQLYQESLLTLVGPDGEVVDLIGPDAKDPDNSDDLSQARQILLLLECLVVNQQGGLELSEPACAGLADMLLHVQELMQ